MFKIAVGVFSLIMFFMVGVHIDVYVLGDGTDDKLRLEEEIKNLQAADAAWRSNDTEFRKMRKQEQVTSSEISEFAEFVADLKRKVIEGCETVRELGGGASLHGVDCVKLEDEAVSNKGGALANLNRELTMEERAALLNDELKKLESEFDGMILSQQAKLSGGQESSQSNVSGDTDDMLTDEIAEEVRASPEPIDKEAEPGAGPGVDKQGTIPDFGINEAGDSSDDDIVARQLREAAEAETDPLLKEKLWNEYKKYKKSMR